MEKFVSSKADFYFYFRSYGYRREVSALGVGRSVVILVDKSPTSKYCGGVVSSERGVSNRVQDVFLQRVCTSM